MALSSINKTLIIRLSSLGDVLLSTPFIRGLKDYFPSLQIDFLVKREYAAALEHNPYIDNLILYDNNYARMITKDLKKNKYDLIIDLQNSFRSRIITVRLKSRIVRFNKKNLDKFLLVFFKINRLRNSLTIPERYAETIDRHLLDSEGLDLFLPLNIQSRIPSFPRVVGFCPGSKHFTKRWLPEYFIELGKILVKNGIIVVTLGGAADKQLCRNIIEKIPGAVDYSTEDDLFQIAKDMKSCNVIVCNDSGLMHVACAMKVPVVTVFGSSVREFGFAPYLNPHVILENNNISCRPCSHIGKEECPKKHFKCMKDISPDMVYKATLRIMK